MRYFFSILVSVFFCALGVAQDIQSIADSNNHFAFNLYSELNKAQPGNLFFSPFSISTALAMTYAGARSETEKQMSQTLHFNLDQDGFHRRYRSYLGAIETDTGKDLALGIANSIWIANTCKILTPFDRIVKDDYNSESRNVDFAGHTEEVRQEINLWVEDKTQGKIKDLLAKGMIDSLTRLVLVNAIYFKANWQSPFNQKVTRKAIFHTSDSTGDSASFMNKTEYYRYYSDSTLQAVEIPYRGEKISMLILLPNEQNGISVVEKKLNNSYYLKITENIGATSEVELSIPKFRIAYRSILNDALSEMGMPVAFSDDADFLGIANERLKIGVVVHKAFINVSEEGTEAAAATAVTIVASIFRPSATPPIPFTANHPFIFIIKDNATGSILFMGKITDPAAKG